MLERIGIKLELKTVTIGEFLTILTGPKDQIGIHQTGFGCQPDPGSYAFQLLHSKSTGLGGFNGADYRVPAADDLIEAARETYDPAKRLAIYGKLLQLVQRDVPYIPLFTVNVDYALASKFTWPTQHSHSFEGTVWALEIKPR
jgi:peptide/nickel transport system substrate-binding protein